LTYTKLELDGRLIGYLAARMDLTEASCFLSKIYIKNTYRGRGYARLFLNHLIESCQALGVGQIWLTVNKGNSGSIAAYQKMGFRQDEAIVTDIGNGYVMDDYVMRLDLAGVNATD
jgi:ribosomal protein S18 acetylase RimI-like enzyme